MFFSQVHVYPSRMLGLTWHRQCERSNEESLRGRRKFTGKRTSIELPFLVILMACAFCRPEGLCSPDAGALQAGLNRSPGAKKRRHQDDKAEWYTAIPKSI